MARNLGRPPAGDGRAPCAPSGVGVRVQASAPAKNRKANAAIIALLAKAVDVPESALVIVQGATARNRQIRLPPP